MSSLYRVNYHTRAHKRDEFIEFIKALLLTPFVLHNAPHSVSELSLLDHAQVVDGVPGHANTNGEDAVVIENSIRNKTNSERYCEILGCIEDLIADHRRYAMYSPIEVSQVSNTEKRSMQPLSRLAQLVPSIGPFFTHLPLQKAFKSVDAKRGISGRRNVPPSFNDIRHILNSAQVMAIASTLKLVTFDGDMTLYSDGDDFGHDSPLTHHLITLLMKGKYVAIVTAAGYGSDHLAYEKRLSGLLSAIQTTIELKKEMKERFFVMGGECNYLFRFNAELGHLSYLPEHTYQPEHIRILFQDYSRISKFLDIAQSAFETAIASMNLSDSVHIIRKQKAIGIVPKNRGSLTREQLDEIALSAQRRLNRFQFTQATAFPFCAFNGGNDVWVDVGNKLIGVSILQHHLGADSRETLHVGDQFLSTGNDYATRTACCTVWITSPEETEQVLSELNQLN